METRAMGVSDPVFWSSSLTAAEEGSLEEAKEQRRLPEMGLEHKPTPDWKGLRA